MNNYDNIILKNKYFLEDHDKFSIFYKIKKSSHKTFFSDGENYILGYNDVAYPIWIWTKNDLDYSKINEIEKVLKKVSMSSNNNTFICKKELYNFLKNDIKSITNILEMNFFRCDTLKKIKKSPGFLSNLNYSDKTVVAKFWQEYSKEMAYQEELTYQESLEEVSNWLDNDLYFVWRNQEGKPVSLGSYSIDNNIGKISHIYTPKELREKGYCQSLVYEITKKILDNGLIPTLYTDANYPKSNYIYKKIGYKEKGKLIKFKIEL